MKAKLIITILFSILFVALLFLPFGRGLDPDPEGPAMTPIRCEESNLNQAVTTFIPPATNTTILIPDNIVYKSVKVVKGGFRGECAGTANLSCNVYVNDVLCVNMLANGTFSPAPRENFYYLPQTCINALHGGMNKIHYISSPGANMVIRDVSLEMKVCL